MEAASTEFTSGSRSHINSTAFFGLMTKGDGEDYLTGYKRDSYYADGSESHVYYDLKGNVTDVIIETGGILTQIYDSETTYNETYISESNNINVYSSSYAQSGGGTLQQFADGAGQVMNAAGVMWGAAEMGGQYVRQGNGAQTIGKAIGVGTQQTAKALNGSVKTLGSWGKTLGTAGMVFSTYSYGAQLADPNQTISTATHVNFWLSAGLYTAGAIIGGPVIGGAALIYGAFQLGSYMINGNTVEENILGK